MPFPRNAAVVVASEWSAFDGLRGVVVGEDTRRRPLPSILVYVPTADVADWEKEVYFTEDELRPADGTG